MDVHMLNHDGNLMDAASIAAITALCHFRRPDVGIQGDEVTVVSQQQTAQQVVFAASLNLLGNALNTKLLCCVSFCDDT